MGYRVIDRYPTFDDATSSEEDAMTRRHIGCWTCVFLGCAMTIAASSGAFAQSADLTPNAPNAIEFPVQTAKFVRVIIPGTSSGEPCFDEVEVFDAATGKNVALASLGAKASASSCIAGYAVHQIAHLNDGLYGNSHSWIAAAVDNQWAQIELAQPAKINKVVVSRDREGKYNDRMPFAVEIQVSADGKQWQKVRRVEEDPLKFAFLRERESWTHITVDDHLSPRVTDRPALPGGPLYWSRIAKLAPLDRVLALMEELGDRLAAKGVDVSAERRELAAFRERQKALAAAKPADPKADETLYLDARLAKRKLLFRDPELALLAKIVFVKRHPYLSSHNYSDILDSQFRSGGGICQLDIPLRNGRLEPADAKLTTLFDGSAGIARDVAIDFDAKKVFFAFRPEKAGNAGYPRYWHMMAMNADGSDPKRLTDGPYHDTYPCPLPDGGLAFMTTRSEIRFLCWRPQAVVLYRMDNPFGSEKPSVRPLSFANLTEWSASVMRDGRILWTRSEYLDKGADFGHTLWAIHPDGSHPTLLFGNNTPNCYMNAREVPDSNELLCTLFSHGGDHNGPLGLIDRTRGPFDPKAVTNITPDSRPHYNMDWPRASCFRDPTPVSRDYFLASHAPADKFGLFVVDRYGNRELVYFDPAIGSMCPIVFRPTQRPPVLSEESVKTNAKQPGQFTVLDVYQGMGDSVPRGKVKYLRVCEEVRSPLERLPNGECRQDYGEDFQDHYASPSHVVTGPYGWTTYVAKASLGLVPVEADGSANFSAPSGKVLYFEALDENLNEIQRMRSVVQLQPGERRSCIGCHDDRKSAPPTAPALAIRRAPSKLDPPSWGTEAFSYEKIVQPVWDAKCVRCHDANDKKINLTSLCGKDRVPASYRTLIAGGWVHYFDYTWGLRHNKAEPMTFGTVKSKLWNVLEAGHHDVQLTPDERHRVKCWIDLNCPLWPNYDHRMTRPGPEAQMTKAK
jgi:hypothetical protein